jgi:hypothetical protein
MGNGSAVRSGTKITWVPKEAFMDAKVVQRHLMVFLSRDVFVKLSAVKLSLPVVA